MPYKLEWQETDSLRTLPDGDTFCTGANTRGYCCGIYVGRGRIRHCKLDAARGCGKGCKYYRKATRGGTRQHCALMDPHWDGGTKIGRR